MLTLASYLSVAVSTAVEEGRELTEEFFDAILQGYDSEATEAEVDETVDRYELWRHENGWPGDESPYATDLNDVVDSQWLSACGFRKQTIGQRKRPAITIGRPLIPGPRLRLYVDSGYPSVLCLGPPDQSSGIRLNGQRYLGAASSVRKLDVLRALDALSVMPQMKRRDD